MASYADIFDNAFERRISQNVSLRLKTLDGTVYNSAVLSSRGVSPMSNQLDKEFRVRKTFKVGVTGYFEPDHSQTNLYGNGGNKAGPFGRTRNMDDAWPDPDLVHGLRTQSLEYGLFSDRSIFPFFYGDQVMNTDPMLVAETLETEMESFATNAAMRYAQSFYTSGNTKFAYASSIVPAEISIEDSDTSFANDFPLLSAPSTYTSCSILSIDLSSKNQYALHKLEIGMSVDLVASSGSFLINAISGTGVKATGKIINIDWMNGKVWVAFFANAAATGNTSSISYVKNQLVDMRDFVRVVDTTYNVVPTAQYAGDNVTPGGTWVTCDLVPANTVSALSSGDFQKAMPLGINDWLKTAGQLLSGTGYQNGSVGNGIIDVDNLSMFKSYHEDLANAAITDSLMDGVVHRLIPQYNRFQAGATPDTAFTTYGVLQTYRENKRAIADLTRMDGSLDLTKEGATTGITFQTSSGVPIRMIADPFCDSGRVYILKVANNWAVDVPPTVPGADSAGPVNTPSGLPWRFVAKRAGWGSNVVPRQRVVSDSTRFTQDSYVPMECKMQLCCTNVPIGAIITSAKETTRFGSSTNVTV